MAVKKETEVITIPAIDIRTATITIKGDSPLIVHKWSEKAKKMMLDKQMKVATTKKKSRSRCSRPENGKRKCSI